MEKQMPTDLVSFKNKTATKVNISMDFLKSMSSRRSIREFSNEKVDMEIIKNAIATAGTAPSGANKQPWFFAVITDQSMKNSIKAAAEDVEFNFYNKTAPQFWLDDLRPFGTCPLKPYLAEAPVLIGIFSRTNVETTELSSNKAYYPIESTCIATGLLITALHLSGLSTLTHTPRPLSFLNGILGLNSSFKPLIILVVGYPASGKKIPSIDKKSLNEIMKIYETEDADKISV
ncbi:MAG: hypothetical protein B7Y39_05525 [Bdellovibrio sp. 28-41-41]|nr:MAG: hypothetical protein B7Y39_05525 [Bdellovibrio sp. 28-41-41]